MRREISAFVSGAHADAIETTATGDLEASYISGRRSITVHTGLGTIVIPWDARPLPIVGTPARLTVEVEEGP